LTAAGCTALIVGAGAGAYTYTAGELKRTYPVEFDATVTGSLESLNDLKIKHIATQATGLKTTITAERTDGTPVTVTVIMVAQRISEVRVRSGLVGYWDKQGSELIHATLAKKILPPE
jgi:hypothetical protein